MTTVNTANPPRENLVRGMMPGLELRGSEKAGGMPTLVGHFSVFNEWTRIDSAWEGTFLERIAPSAFDKTFSENRAGMRVLFNHGKDPFIGDKPLGPISELGSDERGARYEVPLFDTAYNRELLPGLQAGVYGASFRFKVMREDFAKRPETSEHNPDGIPERTILEAKVMEFGPVTFPVYEGTSAGVRSLTDDYIAATIFGDPERLHRFVATHSPNFTVAITPSDPTPAAATSEQERREHPNKFNSREEFLAWATSQS